MAYVAIIIVTLFVVTNLPRILAGAHEVTNTHLIIHCIENKSVSRYLTVIIPVHSSTVQKSDELML